jgi:hypothetical protein
LGSQGSINVTGGLGNSNLATVQDNASVIGSSLRSSILTAYASGFHKNQMIKITNALPTIKANTYNVFTEIEVANISPTIQRYILDRRITNIDLTSTFNISNTGGNIWRFTIVGGSGDFANCYIGDELQISTSSNFLANNMGYFPIVNIDNTLFSWVEVINNFGFAEAGTTLLDVSDVVVQIPFINKRSIAQDATTEITVESISQDIYRYRWTGAGTDPNFVTNGAQIEDNIVIDGSQFSSVNKGTFRVINVTNDYFEIINPNGIEETVVLGETILKATNIGINVTVSNPFADTTSYVLASGSWSITPLVGDIVTISAPFTTTGNFKVISATSTQIDVLNGGATPQVVALTSLNNIKYENSLDIYTIDSILPNDELVIANLTTGSWFSSENQGRMDITVIGRVLDGRHYINVYHTTYKSETIVLGYNYQQFIIYDGRIYESYRTITNIVINEADTAKTFIYYTGINTAPTINYSKILVASGSQISSINKLGFSTIPKIGIDGYKYWTGLLRKVQRAVDGYAPDSLNYPGIKAAGVQVDVLPPLLKIISLAIDVRPISGVPLSIISDSIKTTVISYVNALGVGQDVILSQIIKKVQEVPGVESVRITYPAPISNVVPERIIIADNEKSIIFAEDIIVG